MRLIFLALCLFTGTAYAEFFIWYDEQGVKHVSNVPPHCIEKGVLTSECRTSIPTGDPGRVAATRRRQADKIISDQISDQHEREYRACTLNEDACDNAEYLSKADKVEASKIRIAAQRSRNANQQREVNEYVKRKIDEAEEYIRRTDSR